MKKWKYKNRNLFIHLDIRLIKVSVPQPPFPSLGEIDVLKRMMAFELCCIASRWYSLHEGTHWIHVLKLQSRLWRIFRQLVNDMECFVNRHQIASLRLGQSWSFQRNLHQLSWRQPNFRDCNPLSRGRATAVALVVLVESFVSSTYPRNRWISFSVVEWCTNVHECHRAQSLVMTFEHQGFGGKPAHEWAVDHRHT